jgi:curli biogenesis system outer membrane secretion channel CsgG
MSSMSAFVRAVCVAAGAVAAACASESHQTVATEAVESSARPYAGPKSVLALGAIQNRSPYMTGMFSDGVDRLGGQAKTILQTHLSQTGRFVVVDRGNMDEIAKEALIAGTEQDLTGARFVVTGEVTEFGRRETGDRELFGILGRGRTQVAYSKMSLNVVDVRTSQVVYSVQGAGEYALSEREVLGFGSTASYDATLNGKVLNLSILDAVNKLVAGVEAGAWTSPAKP